MESTNDSNGTDLGEGTWGRLAVFEGYGRVGDKKDDYPEISFEESKTKYTTQMHASHGMLFARSDKILWDLYNVRAAILMQMRFDGLIGFPGGLVETGEDVVTGLNRELEEEIHLDLKKYSFTEQDHMATFYHAKKNFVLHFFTKEVTLGEFREIEEHALQADEHGIETMGSIRPPLYTMGDNFRGLPAFLTNHFAGNAKEELLQGLSKLNILTNEEIQKAFKAAEDYTANK